jgi:tetratricopeptide (TPR) repeat protein
VLRLQTEIATAVANALKVTLLSDVSAKIELGGTTNPAAFDAYLRASKLMNAPHGTQDMQSAIEAYSEAIRVDPKYALALAGRSLARSRFATTYAPESLVQKTLDDALTDVRQAAALAPDLVDTHLAAARLYAVRSRDYGRANEEYERAVTVAPGSARALGTSGRYAVLMGRSETGIAAVQRAVVLDPLNPSSHVTLGDALYFAHRYERAVAAYRDALVLDSDYSGTHGMIGLTYYGLGGLQSARSSCEGKSDQHWSIQVCLAVTFHRLGQQADAEAALARLRAASGHTAAYQYAEIYAQWDDIATALKWLDTALRVHDSGLTWLKVDPLVDPLRKEPRFQAIERQLKFPD